jgi:uncharacterized low-complexity protein
LLQECNTLELSWTNVLKVTHARLGPPTSLLLRALTVEPSLVLVELGKIPNADMLDLALRIPSQSLWIRGFFRVSLAHVHAEMHPRVESLTLVDCACSKRHACPCGQACSSGQDKVGEDKVGENKVGGPRAKLELRFCVIDVVLLDPAWMRTCWKEVTLVGCVLPGDQRTINCIA